MPCDSLVLNSIDFTTAIGHEGLLAEALRTMGYTVTEYGKSLSFYKNGRRGSYANGKFTTEAGQELDTDEVKRSFSNTVVNHAAKKYGWSVTRKSGKIFLEKRS